MHWFCKPALAAVLAAAGITLAAHAAAAIDLTQEERDKLYDSISGLRLSESPNKWKPEVGGNVPEEVSLYPLPASLQITKVIRYRYAVSDSTVVLADPLTREIVEVIEKKDEKDEKEQQ